MDILNLTKIEGNPTYGFGQYGYRTIEIYQVTKADLAGEITFKLIKASNNYSKN